MSVMLNYIEGFARRRGSKCKTFYNFINIAYGSLKESEYLLYFSYSEKFLTNKKYKNLAKSANRIGGLLYGIIKNYK